MRILVSGGGTAGHVAPILAVVDALLKQDSAIELLYVGQSSGVEARLARQAGIPFAAIRAGKFRRLPGASLLANLADIGSQARNLRDVGRVGRGLLQALTILRKFKPDVIFIKGGYVGLPVGWAARLLRIPYVIHESDIAPGLANRLLATHAQVIATGFPIAHYSRWPSAKLRFTGNPVRASVLAGNRAAGLKHFNLSGKRPVILILGGSQGARAINRAVLSAAPELLGHYDILHVTGPGEYQVALAHATSHKLDSHRYQLYPYLEDDFGLACAIATLVISRAGAGAISELAALAKPTILIPNAAAAAHQEVNAAVLKRAGAVVMLPERELSSNSLVVAITSIMSSESRQKDLANAIGSFHQPNAASILAGLILRVGEKG